jgi:exopolyphosphatase / guanosine-5'-triphosphate,3'-diphosphate pyrophosphatase
MRERSVPANNTMDITLRLSHHAPAPCSLSTSHLQGRSHMTAGRIVAIIDVGSNSVRLLVARELTPSAFEVIDEARFDARLGQGQAGGSLTPEAIERGLRAFRLVTQVARSHAPSLLHAVGTEALRRANNADDFRLQALAQTGVSIRILTAQEEAYASFLGTVNSTSLRDGHIVDVGGGSLEVTRVEGRQFVEAHSAPLGAIYATEHFFRADPPRASDVRALRKAVRQQIVVRPNESVLFGVGGAIRNVARISRAKRRYPLRRLHGFTIDRPQFQRLTESLLSMTADERRKLPGLTSSRADIIHAAAVVVDEVMEMTGAREINVSGQGLREGLVWQELRGGTPILADIRGASIAGLARANGVNELTAEPIAAAAAELFAATRRLHGLGDDDRDLLVTAARLSGIGLHVDYYSRDRHAEYLVHSGDLHGFTHREIVLLAALVRWSNSGTPDLSPYKALIEPDDPRRAAILAVMLGTARAVRRRSPSPVQSFQVTADKKAISIRLSAMGPVDAEIYELERQQKRLEAIFKLPVTLSSRLSLFEPEYRSPSTPPAG